MRALDKKLVQDMKRIRVQALAISLVMACGVATIILSVGSYRSLEETRSVFYDRYRFASIFSSVTRAPVTLKEKINAIPGVSSSELRVMESVLLDVPSMAEPATGLVVSIPDLREPAVNRVYLRSGRMPGSHRDNEVAVTEGFADAHEFKIGDGFQAIINGRKQRLKITGVVLSPEFIYALGPGDMVPDPKRYAVLFMPIRQLRGLFDMTGAFNQVSLAIMRDVEPERVIDDLDRILAPYGGAGAYSRKDQMSHAFLDAELEQLKGMAKIIPPIFLLISAFLVNMILSRLISLEREQIGLLKAVGYSDLRISMHYIKLVLVISLFGLLIGTVTGIWLGEELTKLFGRFYSFPFLIFIQSPDIYLLAMVVSVLSAVAGAAKAILSTTRLPPAVAMQPAAPTTYHSLLARKKISLPMFSQLDVMAFRHLIRWPMRSLMTTIGTALSVALLVTSFFSFDSIDYMIDSIFFRTNRQDAVMSFVDKRHISIARNIATHQGVLSTEAFRTTAVIGRNRNKEARILLTGVEPDARLSRILDLESQPFSVPSSGISISEFAARKLAIQVGELLEIEIPEKSHRKLHIPVVAISESFVGVTGQMPLQSLNRLMRDGNLISGVNISVDFNQLPALYQWVKQTPVVSSLQLNDRSLQKFRETIRQNTVTITIVYIVLAIIITFGVIYNSARIQLSERARELASLRVFGFTRREVSTVLLTEIGFIVLIAQPLGWLMGYLFVMAVVNGIASDLYRIPLIVSLRTLGISSLIVLASAIVSAIIVQQRIRNLDMVRVLKTKE